MLETTSLKRVEENSHGGFNPFQANRNRSHLFDVLPCSIWR
jgi:hypothetical protein